MPATITNPADRRQFLKTLTFSAAISTVIGKTWTDVLAVELQSIPATTGILRLKISDFPALQSESGSVRLAINPVNGTQPSGSFFPVIINRAANNVFHTLNSRCTHQQCVVEAYDPSTSRITCFCHGSAFAIDGRRVAGPAGSALAKFTNTFDGKDTLEIQIPNLGFRLTGSVVPSSSSPAGRYRLDFTASRNVTYEVLHRAALEDAPKAVAFATTADGPLDQTEFSATANGARSLFVENNAAKGFFTVAIKLTPI